MRTTTDPPLAAEKTESVTPAAPAPALPAGGELLLWAVACGLKPDTGWFRAIRLNELEVRQLAAEHRTAVDRLRLLSTLGALLGPGQIAVLLRARLAELMLGAASVKDLVEAARVFEKLPAAPPVLSAGTEPTAPLSAMEPTGLEELDLESAIAEARRLLNELDGGGGAGAGQ